MMQLKLFELIETEVTTNQLIQIFGDQSVQKFSEKIIGIAYGYGANNYVEILKKVRGLNLRQVIISSSSFFSTIDYCVDNNFGITDLKFIYPIPPESVEYVAAYISQINTSLGREKIDNKLRLFKELDWITSDECIDIKSVSFDIKNETGLYFGVELYNNGVLLINNESIIGNVKNLIIETLE